MKIEVSGYQSCKCLDWRTFLVRFFDRKSENVQGAQATIPKWFRGLQRCWMSILRHLFTSGRQDLWKLQVDVWFWPIWWKLVCEFEVNVHQDLLVQSLNWLFGSMMLALSIQLNICHVIEGVYCSIVGLLHNKGNYIMLVHISLYSVLVFSNWNSKLIKKQRPVTNGNTWFNYRVLKYVRNHIEERMDTERKVMLKSLITIAVILVHLAIVDNHTVTGVNGNTFLQIGSPFKQRAI